ncbi:MAG: ribosome silencing factor [Terriglobia bacterium]|jgi:ribosome-associated protein
MMTAHLRDAVRAAQDRKAIDLDILNLEGICAFTDFFLICSGTSSRHMQAICDAILEELEKSGVSPTHVEGYGQAEWILLDYLNFVVHIFSERARSFYDLERLWKTAAKVKSEELGIEDSELETE